MVNNRMSSSVTTATDSSPNCVGSVVGDTSDASGSRGKGKRMERGNSDSSARNLEPSFMTNLQSQLTMVDDSSSLQADPESAKQIEEEEEGYDDELFEAFDEDDDDGENHEVELRDIEGLLFGGSDDDNDEDREEDVPESRGMKNKFMSHVKLNPKLKNFMMSIGKDVNHNQDCDESVEVSFLGEMGHDDKQRSVMSNESNEDKSEIAKEDGSNSDKLEAIDEFPKADESRAGDVEVVSEKDDDASVDDLKLKEVADSSGSEVEEVVLNFDPEEVKETTSKGKKKFIPRVNKLNSKLKSFLSSKVLDTKCEESVELSLHDSVESSKYAKMADEEVEISAEVVSCADELENSKKDVQPGKEQETGDELLVSKEDGSADSDRLETVGAVGELHYVQAEDTYGDLKADISHDGDEKVIEADDIQIESTEEERSDANDPEVAKANGLNNDDVAVENGSTIGDTKSRTSTNGEPLSWSDVQNEDSEISQPSSAAFEGELTSWLERPKSTTPGTSPSPADGKVGEQKGTTRGGMKKLIMSRVKSKKLKSFRFVGKGTETTTTKVLESDEISLLHDVQPIKNEVEPAKVVSDEVEYPEAVSDEDEVEPPKDTTELESPEEVSEEDDSVDDDEGDDEFDTSNMDKNEITSRSSKAGLSGLNISVFGRTTRSGSRSKIVTTVAEEEKKEEKPFEFRQMKVTLKFKALAGVSSQNKTNSQIGNGVDETVKAVVTYRRNTIASDRFVSTHVPSLPILREQTPDPTNVQVYAQWPGWQQQKDDDSTASGLMMSSVTLTRTVRRVRHFDNVSSGGTAGGSGAKEPAEKDGKRFLASLSKAFAPELLDLQVGLMIGSSEIIPLGIATVVLPGEYKRMQLDIPVVRNHSTGEKKHRGVNISQLGGKAKTPQDHVVFFSADKDTQYKIHEGAFLRLELNVEPSVEAHATSLPRHLNANTRNAQFRSGPINQAIRRRRKMDQLMSTSAHKKLPLHQRVQLYLELRSRKGNTSNNKASPNSQEVCISRQTDVSEVSFALASEVEDDDASASLLVDQYDMRRWASDVDTMEEPTAGNNSLVRKRSKSASAPASITTADNQTKEDAPSLVSQQSNASAGLSAQIKEAPSLSLATTDTSRQDERLSGASQHSNASHDPSSSQHKEASASLTSVASLLANDESGRLTPASHTDHDDDVSHFSSSLHSVFTTNHPQKHALAQNMMDLLANLVLCEDERNALKYYAHEHENEKCAHYCVPFIPEDLSIQDTYADEETLASLESLPVKVNRRRDPFAVDS